MVLPRVNVIFEAMFMSCAAQILMFPSVVVSGASRFTLRPALNKVLPLTVVTGAFTLTSRPQQATKFPFVAVTAAFMLMSRTAFNLKVVGLELAVQVTASLMRMSPLPAVAVLRFVTGGVPGVVLVGPVAVLIVTLLVTNRPESVEPEMLSEAPLPTVKSCGSISQ